MKYKMQFMGPTGTNAVEAALKLARRATGRQLIVAFNHGFHGMTLGSLACTANSYFRNASGVPLQHVMHQPFGSETADGGAALGASVEALENLKQQFLDTSSGLEMPAAFIVESLQAEGGVNMADGAWLKKLRQIADDLGALLIIDDIQSGCGRTGTYFSFDGMDVEPDIVCLAKGLGGFGTPIAMNLIKPEHDKHWQPGEHTGTFRGQNLSFIAGRIGLEYFDDDSFLTAVKEKGEIMRAALEQIAASFCKAYPAADIQVRGKGMMQAIDVGDGALAKTIASRCFDAGLLIGPCGTGGRVIKLIPPLTIPEEDLRAGLSILADAVMTEVKAA